MVENIWKALVILAISSPCFGDVFDTLEPKPGWYQFVLHAEEGYNWNGKEKIVVGPYYFKNQRSAWKWVMKSDHVRQISLKSWAESKQ